MQTPAEAALIDRAAALLTDLDLENRTVLNVGAAGLWLEGLVQTSFLFGYLARWRPLAPLARAWDDGVNRLAWRSMQGHACLTLRKAGQGAGDHVHAGPV